MRYACKLLNARGGRRRRSPARRPARPPGSQSQRRGRLSVRRQLPADATPGNEIDVQGPLVDAAARVAHADADGRVQFHAARARHLFPRCHRSRRGRLLRHAQLAASRPARARRACAASSRSRTSSTASSPTPKAGGDLGEPDIGDGGLVLVDNRRMRASLRPSMSFELSPRRELQFDAGYADVNFEEEIHRRAGGLHHRRCFRGAASRDSTNVLAHDAPARRALRHRHRRK